MRAARVLRRITRSDSEFEVLCRGWNRRFHADPLEIVFPANTDEVAVALLDAQERGIPFRIRSGGHSVDGFSGIADGIIIDLRDLHTVDVSSEGTQARVGAGAHLHDVYEALSQIDRVIPGGVGRSVGMGGLITGGGLGGLTRWLGALAHNVISFDLVDAQGQIHSVTPDSHPDLYWACLGAGGGNFGIITAFTLRMTPLSAAVWYRLSWPWSQFEDVYGAWQQWAPAADSRMTPLLVMWPTTTANRVDVAGIFPGRPEQLEDLLGPLLEAVPPPSEKQITPTTFVAAMAALLEKIGGEAFDVDTRAVTASPFFDQPLDRNLMGILRDWHTKAPGNSFVWCLPGGGELAAAADRGTQSFAHGHMQQLMLIRSDWSDLRDDDACISWVSGLYDLVQPYASGAYLNWTNTDIESRPHRLYRDSYTRLVQIKHRYDPNSIFDFAHAIPASIPRAHARRLRLPDETNIAPPA
ncbi:putative FAD-linked oxidoreductase YvdP [Mycobacteroides salmoniphilum]|uniref:Putative FAD-linked oxidoreductase YvdP n=1 Tax=Mycobacteroides salmoniphilum TaxID=404941 RepID=A0A4R8STD6_9MYCO|nr:putative FAD-linked oxidoreductase YvdP [Mycobacteroides salmoniphilum]TEA03725.1 putative FAD-linked oxidoreductase YvdP [Mycobacteroides salmoniphilum]